MCIMMYIVLASVPIMLCVKPIYLLGFKSSSKKGADVAEAEEFVGSYATSDDNFVNANSDGKILKAKDDGFNLRENIVASY